MMMTQLGLKLCTLGGDSSWPCYRSLSRARGSSGYKLGPLIVLCRGSGKGFQSLMLSLEVPNASFIVWTCRVFEVVGHIVYLSACHVFF
jgi:hypothetical protein